MAVGLDRPFYTVASLGIEMLAERDVKARACNLRKSSLGLNLPGAAKHAAQTVAKQFAVVAADQMQLAIMKPAVSTETTQFSIRCRSLSDFNR